ncbi:MAG: VOC family protein [Chloroflexota bacterium]
MAKFWFDHLHLVVTDPAKTADFYVRAFGAEKVSVNKMPNGRVRADLNIVGGRMIINTPSPDDARQADAPHKRYGNEHFGMKVDDIKDGLNSCKAAGAEVVREITEVRPGVKIAFIMAPDDVLIELVEMK